MFEKTYEMKDAKLNSVRSYMLGNIAQFISFGVNGDLRFMHINGVSESDEMTDRDLIVKLIQSAGSNSVNIRKFKHSNMKGNKLIFNKTIRDLDEILEILKRNRENGYYSIINENIDICDGGVSGVILGEIIEFSPEDTPKCVDKEGVCSLPKAIGYKMLKQVYGFSPEISFKNDYRVEFSIHPKRQGVDRNNTIIWEYEKFSNFTSENKIIWPNNFSKFIGDKAFGLLLANCLDMKVPRTTVISRNISPFTFGETTGIYEKWIRTCPVTKKPGKFYSGDEWVDPFMLMNSEEKKGNEMINIASILSQDSVDAVYSGAAIIKEQIKDDIIEGTKGTGDLFMLGEKEKSKLPNNVLVEVKKINNRLRSFYNILGEVSIEWVYDGKYVWVVQLNQLKQSSTKNYIVDGSVSRYEKYYVDKGLEGLRDLIEVIKGKNIGVELIGNVGITSHFGDLLRIDKIPSKINRVSNDI